MYKIIYNAIACVKFYLRFSISVSLFPLAVLRTNIYIHFSGILTSSGELRMIGDI